MTDSLAGYGKSSCFLNHNFFHRGDTHDWLKPFVLFFDHLLFESEYTFETFYMFSDATLPERLRPISLYLDGFCQLPERAELRDQVIGNLRDQILNKDGRRYNKRFLDAFSRRLKENEGCVFRGWHYSAFGLQSELVAESNDTSQDALYEIGGRKDGVIIDEIVDSQISSLVHASFGIPSIVDPLQEWLISRFRFGNIAKEPRLDRFHHLILNEVPDFTRLDWDVIFQLRSSPHRKAFQAYLSKPKLDLRGSTDSGMRDALWRLATDAMEESSVPKSILKGVAANLPSPIAVNPVGVFLAYKDVLKAVSTKNEFGWLFFLAQVRSSTRTLEPTNGEQGAQ